MNRENLRRTAVNSVKGVRNKIRRAKLYAAELEVEGVDELLDEIDERAAEAIKVLEEAPVGE